MIKKADIILGVIFLAIGIAASVMLIFGGAAGETIRVTVDGAEYGTYELSRNQIIKIEAGGHSNTIEIRDGAVSVIDADCPDRLCIRQGWIRSTSQSIVCLPNRVVIEIIGPADGGPDAYSS